MNVARGFQTTAEVNAAVAEMNEFENDEEDSTLTATDEDTPLLG